MPSALPTTEIGVIVQETLPMAMDDAVSKLSPLFAQERNPVGAGFVGAAARLPIIKRRPMSSAAGPTRKVVVVGNLSGAQFTPGGAIPAPGAAETQTSVQGWGAYTAAIAISHQEMIQLETGQLKVANYMDQQLNEMSGSIARAINGDVFTGNAADTIDGLYTRAINGAVFAGINRAIYPNFACQDYDNLGVPRALTVPVIDAAWDAYRGTIEATPGQWVGLCDVNQYNALRALTAGVDAGVTVRNSVGTLQNLGTSGIEYDGMPIFGFASFPANVLVFVNFDQLAWEFAGDVPFSTNDEGIVGDTKTWRIFSYPQLCLDNPGKSAFQISDLV